MNCNNFNSCNNCNNGNKWKNCNNPFNRFSSLVLFLLLCVFIFYQVIITFFFPFRWNIIILFVEIFIQLFLLYNIIWP